VKRLVDRFGEHAASCSAIQELRELLHAASSELGFDHFALLHHASLSGRNDIYVRIDNYPDSWVAELVRSGGAGEDPVHAASRRTNTGFAWSELQSLVRLT
jgi:LuxR family quorum-sensing system transcriptional regulator CciR